VTYRGNILFCFLFTSSIMMSWACKPCSNSDPASDTVKVDYSKFSTSGEDKENSVPSLQANDKIKDEAKARAEAERKECELKRQRDQEQEHEQRRQEEAAETLRREEEDRRRLEEEQEQLRRQEEVQRQKEIEEAAQRELEEQERKRAEEQRVREDQEAQERVSVWLKKNGFGSMNAKKKSLMSSLYPLHCAVSQNDSAMVQLLIRFNADPQLANSSKQTPRQLADKLNKKGSHSEVLAVLPSA